MQLVSIITAAFNCEQFIAKAIDSVLNQTHENWELLIADDGSSDATLRIIDQYAARDPRIRPYHNEKNSGIVRTRNKLFRQVRGKYVTLLDADDWIGTEKLEKQVSFLTDSRYEAVGVDYYNVGPTGDIAKNVRGKFENVITKKDIYQLPFWLPSIMITRNLLERAGGYSCFFEDNACFEDLYWIYDLLEVSDIGFINEPLYYYRHNPSSVTKTLNLKRLASKELVDELIHQRIHTGTDWLKKGDLSAANIFMNRLLQDKTWEGTCYQTYAAIKLDENDLDSAYYLLKQAFHLTPFKLSTYRTFWYYLRKKRMLHRIQ